MTSASHDDAARPWDAPGQNARFCTTHWSVVLTAREKDSRADRAMDALCRAYWYPLYSYVRRMGQTPHDAEDLTQAFFARLLEKDSLAAARREKGRFRTFLLTALKHFLANEWDRRHAQKRGGFHAVVSIDRESAESRFASEPASHEQPDTLFDRQWAAALLEQVMARLRREYAASDREQLFQHLGACLLGENAALSYADIAARLGLTEAAVKMAAHRMRGRYREILREEIAETVASPEEIEDEIRRLFSAFGR